MATTTNYGWTTPDDTALVKDGASAIRTLGSSVDTTTKNLNPETTLGDLAFRSSTANVKTRLGIGSTGQVLTVAGGVPTWASAGAAGLPAFSAHSTSDQTLTNGTTTKILFPTEEFDTDSNFASSRFTPTVAGYYQLSAAMKMTGNTASNFYVQVYKNGADYKRLSYLETAYDPATGGSICVYANGTTDYYEIYALAQVANPKIIGGSITCWFTGVGVRA